MNEVQEGNFVTTSGRSLTLARLLMVSTYDGHLEGTAEAITKHLRKRMHEAVISFLPPTQAWVVLDDGEKQLPPLQWFAVFHSRDAVNTRDADYSSRLGICWFTNTLPESLTAILQNVVARVDYEACAEDYDIMP